jgi:hydroxyacylglutathione hydrolase
MAEIRQIPSRSDNFSVLIHDTATGATAAIDAPDEASIERMLADTGWTLSHILVTHDHPDHVEGIPGLKAKYKCQVIAPALSTKVPDVDARVKGGDQVKVGRLVADVIDTPGHSADHIAYHFARQKTLFAGDTLFALGCGRIIDSTAVALHGSLQKLAALPPETMVYCGHEYTLSNARFALSVEPDNMELRTRALEVENMRAQGRATLPTSLSRELATNPFLRTGNAAIRARLNMAAASDAAVFAELRERKNRF